MSRSRRWHVHPINRGIAIVLFAAVSWVNLYPRVRWWDLDACFYHWSEFHHGWPLVYMVRDFQIANADMGGMVHKPWPISTTSPIRHFDFARLFLDVAVGASFVAIAVGIAESILRHRRVRFRCGLRRVLMVGGAFCIYLAIGRVFPLLLVASYHVLPSYIVIAALVLVGVSITNRLWKLIFGCTLENKASTVTAGNNHTLIEPRAEHADEPEPSSL